MKTIKTLVKFLLYLALIASSLLYLAWRVSETVPYAWGPAAAIIGWILLLTEIAGCIGMIIHFGTSDIRGRMTDPLRKIEEAEAAGSEDAGEREWPDVDIFVPTYGEPVELLEKTVKACKAMRYEGNFHVWLLDDASSAAMSKMAGRVGVGYLSRRNGPDAKAGNLNAALKVTKAPYVAVFDADMAPRPEFLMRTVPLLDDEGIGFVQTPQHFRTPDLFQAACGGARRLPNEQDYFYRSIEPARNHSGAVILGGSNVLIRRSALEAAGGFMTGTLTEDIATGIEIEKKGFDGIATAETLADGITPENLRALIRQRQRWARGCLQTVRRTQLLFGKGLSIKQRFIYMVSIGYWYFPVRRFIYFFAPLIFALGGLPVMLCNPRDLLIFWLPMALLASLAVRVFSGNVRSAYWSRFYETILTPFLFLPVLKESFGIHYTVFEVTSKDGRGGWRAAYTLPFLAGIALTGAALARSILMTIEDGTPIYALLIFWLAINLYDQITALLFVLAVRRPYGIDKDVLESGHRHTLGVASLGCFSLIFIIGALFKSFKKV